MIPLEFAIERRYFKTTYCIGRFSVDGIEMCDTLEDRDRGLSQEMSTAKILLLKVFGKTAIPYGRYEVRLTYSPKFAKRGWCKKYGGLVPEIIGVPGFSNVRLHVGNTSDDTEGCPLVGENRAVGKVLYSTQAYYDLMDYYFMPAHQRGQKMFITITRR